MMQRSSTLMFLRPATVAVAFVAFTGIATAQQAAQLAAQKKQDKLVHLNQIQVIGSHNSYHSGFAPNERKFLEQKSPKTLRALDYGHAPLDHQLSGGVRQIEIDIFADPQGGSFAHPAIVRQMAAAGLPADPDFDPNHELDKPGFKVMHVQDLDERSTCHTFVACLTTVRTWSKQNPRHLPIFILVETKEGAPKDMPYAVKAEPFTAALFDAMDTEIRSVFQSNEIITPDEVRGNSVSLADAVHAGNWPTLAKARGRIVFLMDQAHVGPTYTAGHPGLKGRIAFTNATAGAPDAAFIEQNGNTKAEIDSLVQQGYLVRTRSDEPTEQARTNDTTRRDITLTTGAQMISTDYPSSEPASWSGYSVGLPGGFVARCNPVNKPAACVDSLLEPAPASAPARAGK